MGLLEKAVATPPAHSSFSDFRQWAESSPFAHCGVFSPAANFMLLHRAYRIDSATVLNSVSTRDFWAGSAAGEKWILLERGDERFAGFLQFLGDEAKEKAERIAILKLRENSPAIFFAYDSASFESIPNEEKFRRELLSILENEKNFLFREGDEKKIASLLGNYSTAFFFTVSTESTFQKMFSGCEKNFFGENPQAKAILLNTIFEEFFFETKKQFQWPDFVFAKDFSKIQIVSILARKEFEEAARGKIFEAGKRIFSAPLATQIAVGGFARRCGAREIISRILRGET